MLEKIEAIAGGDFRAVEIVGESAENPEEARRNIESLVENQLHLIHGLRCAVTVREHDEESFKDFGYDAWFAKRQRNR